MNVQQVESLMSEIENLAALQGEEEARRHQSILDEVETLQGQLMKTKKLESLSGDQTLLWSMTNLVYVKINLDFILK